MLNRVSAIEEAWNSSAVSWKFELSNVNRRGVVNKITSKDTEMKFSFWENYPIYSTNVSNSKPRDKKKDMLL